MSPFCSVGCKRNNYVYVKAKTLCKLCTDKKECGRLNSTSTPVNWFSSTDQSTASLDKYSGLVGAVCKGKEILENCSKMNNAVVKVP